MYKDVDLLILGGGCAGLSLASRLAEFGKQAPKVVILEKRENYVNDRTWCFWNLQNPEYQQLTSHAWPSFEVANHQHSTEYDCTQHPYLMLESHHFYQAALARIQSNPNIQLMLGQPLLSTPTRTQRGWQIQTGNITLNAALIIDTRPPRKVSAQDSIIWQCFVGYEIETESDCFSPDKMMLMEFDHSFKNGLAFIYILPKTTKKALIEYTVFSEHIISKARLVSRLKKSILKKIDGQSYKTLRTEHGTLPMGNQITSKDKDGSYLHAGLFSGAARPSSGYAFQRIQSWAKKCAESIVINNRLYAFPKEPKLQSFMDKLFLSVIKNNPNIAISIFEDLFRHCNSLVVVKFMSDQASFSDYLHIIRSLPSWPFIQALPSFLIEAMFNRLRSIK
jgi:lycopene beta-cyclase